MEITNYYIKKGLPNHIRIIAQTHYGILSTSKFLETEPATFSVLPMNYKLSRGGLFFHPKPIDILLGQYRILAITYQVWL